MAVPLTPATPGERLLRQMEQERKEDDDARATVWAFLWILFWFKIITVGIIWYVASGSGESLAMIAATTWYWLLIPMFALGGPLLVRWRMIKMRRRREALQQSEWSVEPALYTVHVPPPGGATEPVGPHL